MIVKLSAEFIIDTNKLDSVLKENIEKTLRDRSVSLHNSILINNWAKACFTSITLTRLKEIEPFIQS